MSIEFDRKQSDFVSVCVVDETLIRSVLELCFIIQKNEHIIADVSQAVNLNPS